MTDGGKALAGKLAIGGRLIPAHPVHRKIGSALGVRAELPACRSRPSGPVPKLDHRLFPGDLVPLLDDEGMPPVLRPPVATTLDEALELSIGDLVPIEPILPERNRRAVPPLLPASGNSNHASGSIAETVEREMNHAVRGKRTLCRLEPLLDRTVHEDTEGEAPVLDGRATEVLPRHSLEGLHVDLRVSRRGLDRRRHGQVVEQLLERGLPCPVPLGSSGQLVGRVELPPLGEPGDFGKRRLTRPFDTRAPHRDPSDGGTCCHRYEKADRHHPWPSQKRSEAPPRQPRLAIEHVFEKIAGRGIPGGRILL